MHRKDTKAYEIINKIALKKYICICKKNQTQRYFLLYIFKYYHFNQIQQCLGDFAQTRTIGTNNSKCPSISFKTI